MTALTAFLVFVGGYAVALAVVELFRRRAWSRRVRRAELSSLERRLDVETLVPAGGESKTVFRELLVECLSVGVVTERDVRRMFGVSMPTLKRWVSGENAPVPQLMRAVIFELYVVTRDLRIKLGDQE